MISIETDILRQARGYAEEAGTLTRDYIITQAIVLVNEQLQNETDDDGLIMLNAIDTRINTYYGVWADPVNADV